MPARRDCPICGVRLTPANTYKSASKHCKKHHNMLTSEARARRNKLGQRTPVLSLDKTKTLKSGKRVRIIGVFQRTPITGKSYSIAALAKKLGIQAQQVRDAITRGDISAAGSRGKGKATWRIPLNQSHRMAKLQRVDNDRLWKNGTRVDGLIGRLRKPGERDFMRPILLSWLARVYQCSDAAVRVALMLRALSGMTMLDNKERKEERLVVRVRELARACRIPKSSVQRGVRELHEAGLIHRKRRGSAPSIYRVLDASPDGNSPDAPA